MNHHAIVRRHGRELVGLSSRVRHEVDELPLEVEQCAAVLNGFSGYGSFLGPDLLILVQRGDDEREEIDAGRVRVVGRRRI